jgi:hypothetical protein
VAGLAVRPSHPQALRGGVEAHLMTVRAFLDALFEIVGAGGVAHRVSFQPGCSPQ